MLAQAKVNKLDLEGIPTELSDLNPLEERLISLQIPFMKTWWHSLVASTHTANLFLLILSHQGSELVNSLGVALQRGRQAS